MGLGSAGSTPSCVRATCVPWTQEQWIGLGALSPGLCELSWGVGKRQRLEQQPRGHLEVCYRGLHSGVWDSTKRLGVPPGPNPPCPMSIHVGTAECHGRGSGICSCEGYSGQTTGLRGRTGPEGALPVVLWPPQPGSGDRRLQQWFLGPSRGQDILGLP